MMILCVYNVFHILLMVSKVMFCIYHEKYQYYLQMMLVKYF